MCKGILKEKVNRDKTFHTKEQLANTLVPFYYYAQASFNSEVKLTITK